MTPERKAQMQDGLKWLAGQRSLQAHEHPTVAAMKLVRRERAERLRALRLRPWWRKVWDGVVYVVTGRGP